MLMTPVLLICMSVWMLMFVLMCTTENFQSLLLFKLVPLILGLMGLGHGLKLLGVF